MTAILGGPARLSRPDPVIGAIGTPRLLAAVDRPAVGSPGHVGSGPRPTLAQLLALLDATPILGRGGAGFPIATKLRALRRAGRPVVVVNGAEGEPASAKDRVLLTHRAHLVLDGAVLVADAIGARRVIVAVADPVVALGLAQVVAVRADRRIEVRSVAARFIAGEARALLDTLNGGPGTPPGRRTLPTDRGVGGRPTLLSNVETFAQLAVLARIGPAAFAAVGTPQEPGTTLLSVTGAVARPGVLEVPIGVSLVAVAHAAGAGPHQAVIIGGYHGAWRPADPSTELSQAGLRRGGGTLGAGAVIFVGRDTCGLGELSRVADWLAAQSVRQCGPCTFGLPALAADVRALVAGHAAEPVLRRHLDQVSGGRGACGHPDGAVRFIRSGLAVLAADVDRHRVSGTCGRGVRGDLMLS